MMVHRCGGWMAGGGAWLILGIMSSSRSRDSGRVSLGGRHAHYAVPNEVLYCRRGGLYGPTARESSSYTYPSPKLAFPQTQSSTTTFWANGHYPHTSAILSRA